MYLADELPWLLSQSAGRQPPYLCNKSKYRCQWLTYALEYQYFHQKHLHHRQLHQELWWAHLILSLMLVYIHNYYCSSHIFLVKQIASHAMPSLLLAPSQSVSTGVKKEWRLLWHTISLASECTPATVIDLSWWSQLQVWVISLQISVLVWQLLICSLHNDIVVLKHATIINNSTVIVAADNKEQCKPPWKCSTSQRRSPTHWLV